eukprot:jgi/Mesen1/1599/ME000134S00728
MASRVHPQSQQQSKLARLLVPTLERIIKNASWRKHSKLVQECKGVIEWFGKRQAAAKKGSGAKSAAPSATIPPSESAKPILPQQSATLPPDVSAGASGPGGPDTSTTPTQPTPADDPVTSSEATEPAVATEVAPSAPDVAAEAVESTETDEKGLAVAKVEAPAAGPDVAIEAIENGVAGNAAGEQAQVQEEVEVRQASVASPSSQEPSSGGKPLAEEKTAPSLPGAEQNGAQAPPSKPTPPPAGGASNGGTAPPAPSEGQAILYDEGNVALTLKETEYILHPLHSACETLSSKVVEPALDCFQKLIAHGHLRGEMDTSISTLESKLLLQVVESVCKCYDMADESVELLVLKTLLSSVTTTSLRVHGECLLKAVRTCYNIYLGSKAPVNQTTAKASLTQMLVIVFRRMEADSSTVPVQPIVVADLMEPAERSTSDQNITQFVQSFITKVTQEIEVVFTPAPPLRALRHDGAFEATASEATGGGADLLGETDKDMLDAKYWEISMYKSAAAAAAGVVGAGDKKGGGAPGALPPAEGERDGDGMDVQISNKLRRDAFLVFRALCKLSMKNPPQEGIIDPFAVRGKIVALELLKILLENAGAIFRTNERFIVAIKQYLCVSLLKNCASSLMSVFQLSCSIFMSLVSRFRAGLKAEIGVFFPMIVLRVLENVAHANFQQKMIVLRFLEKLSVDPQILVDVFVNYDCDVDSSNIFERMVNGLLKTAQGVPPGADSTLNPQQDAGLKLAAIKCLVGVLRCMGNWTNRQLRLTEQTSLLKGLSEVEDSGGVLEASLSHVSVSDPAGGAGGAGPPGAAGEEAHAEGSEGVGGGGGADPHLVPPTEAATFEQRRAYKLEVQGIAFLIKAKKIGDTPEEVAAFLRTGQGLDKSMIGDYLGEREDYAMKAMHAYVDSFNFQGQNFDEAIRSFLNGFRLPGEAQKIDRIMEKFAERYCRCNPKAFTSADTAYVLAYSVILLNTDAHNPGVKNKMSKAEFIRNNRGIDDGSDLPEDFMSGLYDRIVMHEIKMKADASTPSRASAQQQQQARNMLGLDAILNLVARRTRETQPMDNSDDVIRQLQEQFKAKAGKSGSVYYAASDVEIIRPMVEVVWAPMLAGFSVPLDNSEDEVVTFQCLEGFRHAIHVTSIMCMQTQRDAFLTSLAKFTSLHSAADIKQKNIDAIKAIIAIADEDGNFLQEAWEHILTCVSRFEHLHLIGEGAPPDATFFAAPQTEADKAKAARGPSIRRRVPGMLPHVERLARRGSYDSTGVGGHGTGVVTTEQMNNLVSNLNMLEQVGSFEMSKIFTRSDRLNSEAIVDFVKALCKVSMEELRSPTDPRVFSLTKIVEISHFNMSRIRLVWSRIWAVLADYFVTVGCMGNLSVAMYAIDSLRQLAMKFLEREELANYNFQNEFLKPFVIVMRRSNSVEIRELIIRCVSQMVFARVGNVKSGWKIMFMVFTTAATDDHKNIVLLAFETIEKVVREYFPYITETETTTFTDCVNCLIAFTNSRFNKDVSLNAIAFLRFCALKLAEGELGVSQKDGKSQPGRPDGDQFTDKDDHVYFWFPLLAGLSELTFDPRPDIRKSALEVLFDTLRFHGHMFSPALWERVFDSVLFPIFDYVRRASEPHARKPKHHQQQQQQQQQQAAGPDDGGAASERESLELEMDAWLYETCTLALQLVVDLFVKFYAVVNPLLGRILALLTGFIKRPHQSLAAIGVAAFVRLMSNAGDLFSQERWDEVLVALQDAAMSTLPDMLAVVKAAEEEDEEEEAQIQASRRPSGAVAKRDSDKEEHDDEGEWEDDEPASLHHAIADVRCKIAVQLLLVQAMTEIYGMHGTGLSTQHTMLVLDTLQKVASHAHAVNSDRHLRFRLQELRSETQMPDPPLLRLESEAFHAYLGLLQRLPGEKPELAKDANVELRLVVLCEEVLQVYVSTASGGLAPLSDGMGNDQPPQPAYWVMPLGSARRRELVARAPLVVATLRAVGNLKDAAFKQHLTQFFPLLAELVSCEHGSPEVQMALSSMFGSRIGPLLLQSR